MKLVIPVFIAIALCSACNTPQPVQAVPLKEVVFKNTTIQAWKTTQYCGGARPTDEMLASMQTPKRLSDQLCFIRKGDKNAVSNSPVASATTNSDGQINIALEPGTYCLIFPNKVDSAAYKMYLSKFGEATANYSALDKKCLDEWFQKPELVFTIVDASVAFKTEFTIHQACSWNTVPCVDYKGPFPP